MVLPIRGLRPSDTERKAWRIPFLSAGGGSSNDCILDSWQRRGIDAGVIAVNSSYLEMASYKRTVASNVHWWHQ